MDWYPDPIYTKKNCTQKHMADKTQNYAVEFKNTNGNMFRCTKYVKIFKQLLH